MYSKRGQVVEMLTAVSEATLTMMDGERKESYRRVAQAFTLEECKNAYELNGLLAMNRPVPPGAVNAPYQADDPYFCGIYYACDLVLIAYYQSGGV